MTQSNHVDATTPKHDRLVREEAASMDEEGNKIAAAHHADTRPQSEKLVALARQLGLDELEETFDAALTKVARRKPSEPTHSVDPASSLKEVIKGRKSA